jgi:hypothetical protein
VTSDDTAQTPADLAIEAYTALGRSFTSAATPEGPGDLPTWSPSSAALICGDHDAVLVDTLITYDQVDALARLDRDEGAGALASTSPTATVTMRCPGPGPAGRPQ